MEAMVGAPRADQSSNDKHGAVGVAPPVSFEREYHGAFNGEQVRYRALAGETFVRDDKGEPAASFFTVAYLKCDVGDPAARPVTFVFNGGPGSSAQWLHMGAFGPRRIVVPGGPDNMGAPPYRVEGNALSILDASDLVFIDPIGTGYSRPLGGRAAKDFWGLMEDARSIADLIQTWTTEHGRWNSPKYLAGESYGTVRACLLADLLSERYLALNGVLLVAAVMDYQNSRPRLGDGAIMSYASFVPTYAAIAWYHGKVDRGARSLAEFLHEVRLFARTEYAQALIANVGRLSSDEAARIAARLAAYTGLDPSYVLRSKLRIPVDRFFKELLRERGRVIGRLDGRYTAIEPESAGEGAESDPTFDAVGGAFTSALHEQLHDIGVRVERPYLPWSKGIMEEWNWLLQKKALNGGGYVNVVPHLGRAMRHNDHLRVLVASGYYDLATPFFGAENALSQDGVVHERIVYRYYEVGHMIFLDEPSRVAFSRHVRDFIQAGVR